MTITNEQFQQINILQDQAARDITSQVRLIAGPGTGKSSVIEKRVLWLLNQSVAPNNIFVVSFTRASTLDLKYRILNCCDDNGNTNGPLISISTLHSLALRALKRANLINYIGTPTILDNWELKNIYDKEFSISSKNQNGVVTQGYTPTRCEDIRKAYEAFYGTGQWNPPNSTPPEPPISDQEKSDYQTYHRNRIMIYSCLLPGEIIQDCITHINAGLLNPAAILGIRYLIVDEYQDLNPVDIQFIDLLSNSGVNTFIAGDDDQSLYSFRFASPLGIQKYHERFPTSTSHVLNDCIRCTSLLTSAAKSLIDNYHDQNRVPKAIQSLYENSDPPVEGIIDYWHFQDDREEASIIAKSIRKLINNGVDPKEILILLSNSKIQLSTIKDALEVEEIPYESPREKSFFDLDAGRFIIGLVRVICDNEDYFAYRLILGCRPGVGITTCNKIAELVTDYNLNYKDLFTGELPNEVFSSRQLRAINYTRDIISVISSWNKEDLLQDHINNFQDILLPILNEEDMQKWEEIILPLPNETTIQELKNYILTENTVQKKRILENIFTRLQIPTENQDTTSIDTKIQIMTMHGAKGLSSKIVFIPGLEEKILPGEKRAKFPGLILEAARMLYVSITRSRAVCILSFANRRYYYGRYYRHGPSRFLSCLGGTFLPRETEFSDMEIENIISTLENL